MRPGVHLQVLRIEREDPVALYRRAVAGRPPVDVLDLDPREVVAGVVIEPEQEPVARSHTRLEQVHMI